LSFSKHEEDDNWWNQTISKFIDHELNFPGFLVVDDKATIQFIGSHLFQEINPSLRKATIIYQSIPDKVIWTACHPNKSEVVLVSANGVIYQYQETTGQLQIIKNFKENNLIEEIGTCAEFSPNGQFLIVGTNQGNVYNKPAF
jgi:hypothetical protein